MYQLRDLLTLSHSLQNSIGNIAKEMGCSSSTSAVDDSAPKSLESIPRVNTNLETKHISEEFAYQNNICDFLCDISLPTNPYRRVDVKPLFVIKSRVSESDSSKKVFINLFRSNEIKENLVEISKYLIKKNNEDCDVYNVIVANRTKYFQEIVARDAMIVEVISELNKKFDQSINAQFILPRIAKGFVGSDAPEYFIVPCSALTDAALKRSTNEGQIFQPFNMVATPTVQVTEAKVGITTEELASHHSASNISSEPRATVTFGLDPSTPNADSTHENDEGEENDLDISRLTIQFSPEEENEFRVKLLRMGFAPDAVEESMQTCKNDFMQSRITLHKLAVATAMHADVDMHLIWSPPLTATIFRYVLDYSSSENPSEKFTAYVVELDLKVFSIGSNNDVISSTTQLRQNIRYKAFFQLHSDILAVVGETASSSLKKLFPNDRISLFSLSSTEEKKAELRKAKLNEWLNELCNDATIFSNPKVYDIIENFFQFHNR